MRPYALLLCLLLAAPFAAAQPPEPGAPPAGFQWEIDVPGRISLLRPDGWFVKKEDGTGNRAVFISREEIVPGGVFLTGLTMFHVDRVSTKTGHRPSVYASAILEGLADRNAVLLRFQEDFPNGIVGRGLRVRNEGERRIIVQYYLIADDEADLFWMLSFEAPEAEWDATWPIGERMLKGLFWR